MVAFLALLAAALFGTGDFLGGRATQRTSILSVLATSHLIGLALILVMAPLMAEGFDGGDFCLGIAASGFGLIGLALLYRGLARGPMAVVAPVTAVTCAALPVLWGVAFGDELSGLHVAGILLGLLSIALVSRTRADAPVSASPRLIVDSLLAGVGFAAFYIVIDGTNEASAPWPIVGSRLLSVTVTLLVAVAVGRSIKPATGSTPLVIGAGVFDTLANVAVLAALNRGMLSLVSVLVSLYPGVTVLLARLVLKERIAVSQVVGLLGALVSIVLLVSG
ncbi:MAG: EamA family transporter [Actinomycetota bacterium]|nr:EamA family transporter [Actinomycetota bacterium]